MTAEQKQRAADLLAAWRATAYALHADRMAALLEELINAPESEPVAYATGYYAGYLSIATVDGRVLPAGTALYTAPPVPSVPDVANTFKRRAEEIVAMAVNRENYAKINRTIADLVTDIANAAEAPTPAEVLTTTNQAQTSSSQVEAPESEPFGYFKAEPFGWTDCAETDDGAIALYTAPPAPSVLDGWRSAIAKEFPLYDEDGLDEDKHCCEWVMLQERKRLHDLLAAAPTPAEAPADVARDAEPWKLLLENLVEGLNKTHWSSWQGTAHFDEYLQEAISAIERDKLKGQS